VIHNRTIASNDLLESDDYYSARRIAVR